jgi:hypothetical protein
VGFIQFNQLRGSLWILLQKMYEKNPQKFNLIFKENSSNLLNSSWVLDRNNNLSGLRDQFVEAGTHKEFQQAQIDLAKADYFVPAENLARKYNIVSERSLSMLFDSCVQNGVSKTKEVLLPEAVLGGGDEKNILSNFAYLADVKYREQPTDRRQRLFNNSQLSDQPPTGFQV